MTKMQPEQRLRFGPYQLDLSAAQVWRGKHTVKLTPKALAVLHVFLTHPGQVVTKEELFQTVWPQTAVSDDALLSCIKELRRVLGDTAKRPRYIETVHRRGFRFIAPLTTAQPVRRLVSRVQRFQPSLSRHLPLTTQHSFVGREAGLAQLHQWLDRALHGERQLVFVTGEPGIGKTTLVEAFLNRIAADGNIWIGRGQCIEHYGAGEAYLPVLEALGRLCREPEGQSLIKLLSQHAPTWLVQMPALLTAPELKMLQRKTQGATRERMLRELAEAVEAMTVKKPLVLWLEDLHWCDVSTLDWLTYVARRREPARLLVIGTYRPVDVLVREHPLRALKQELQMHGYCTELLLDFLSEEAVAKYLAARFGGGAVREPPLRVLAHTIHRRTDGNPLFMVNVADYLVARGVLAQSDGQWELQERVEEVADGVPASLQQLIEQQLERLSSEAQRLLEVASVAGTEFCAAAVAAGMETEIDGIEEQCEALVRQEHFLRASGTEDWPDGTVAARYGFCHAVYQEVVYHRLTARRRQRLHQQIGEREETAYGDRAGERAAELAVHFERGRDYRRAIQYLQQAGENAARRSAHQEAVTLLTKGLELLKTLPDTPERIQQELTLQLTLGASQVITKGYASREVEHTYSRARELCRQVGETPQLFTALGGLWQFHLNRAEFQTVCELGEQLLTLAQNSHAPDVLLMAHNALGQALHLRGELVQSQTHVEQVITSYDPQLHRSLTFLCAGEDPGVICLAIAARNLWLLGYAEQALSRVHQALVLAQELSSPFDLALALSNATILHQWCGDRQQARERAEAVVMLSTEQGFPFLLAYGTMQRGWALAEQGQVEEGIAQMQQGLAAFRAMGAELGPTFSALAAAYAKAGQEEKGLSAVSEALALVNKTGECDFEAELYRLRGELTLQQQFRVQSPQPLTPSTQAEAEAEACFRKAIEVARKQQAKSLELRAVMSLSRLWQQQGKKDEARQLLAKIYNWFTEGFDTKDLQEAKALVEELT